MTTDTRSLGRRWLDFWFAAADPTTLGFMRVVTGVLVIYVHLAYSFDLVSFFGEHAWTPRSLIDAQRRDVPYRNRSLTDWEDRESMHPNYLPEAQHLRKAQMAWYRKIAAMSKAQREQALAYLSHINALATGQTPKMSVAMAIEAVRYAEGLQSIEPSKIQLAGVSFDLLPEAERRVLLGEFRDFLAALPTNSNDRAVVLAQLRDLLPEQRQIIVDFLVKMPEDAAGKEEILNYMEQWNNERRRAHWTGEPIFSIWFHITDPAEMAVAHAAVIVIMVFFTLGLFTRVTSVLTWLAAASYIHRSQAILFGMDTMMNLLLIYMMLGPSGAALSLDRWRAKRRAAKLSRERNGGGIDPLTEQFLKAPPKSASAAFVLRMLQIQFCFIYMAAGLSKLKGDTWWNHYAYWDTLANPEFTMIYYRFYDQMIRMLTSSLALYQCVAAAGVLFTFIMELGLPFLVWTRLRPYMVIGGVLFHFGIGVFMGLSMFGLLMMTLLLCYIPGETIRDQLFPKDAPKLPRN